ncbi:MAG: excinuclease ABC subunit UvrA [Gemmatimonas sp.]|uniref:excinuclease ABC subunit UvrA n=1 Tax=Gemmatimonas sp. UBA7669 TaxID=1946568 RepID=UPI0025BAE79C|nr:excinuclease ABC subunit UvrA [Gemmatimonas sp. UBA7669]MBA3917876.1 excinuclease ABC subunit UvrA [Gemmatimonas sp.]
MAKPKISRESASAARRPAPASPVASSDQHAADADTLRVRGAREHNLRNISVTIPRDKLTVVTGLSGSGKSSLAFDTIYAEGQRRYVESLSAYARQFLGLMEKPDVDSIEGLSPAISIEQKTAGHNPRSTVGTVTEIYDYLRLLYARAGTPHCPNCGRAVQRQSPAQIAEQVLAWPDGTRLEIRAPLVQERKGEFRELFENARKQGFVRAVVDGELIELADPPKLNKRLNHSISVVVDRLVVRTEDRGRITDSVETALRLAEGLVEVLRYDGATPTTEMFSERYGCPNCGISMPELEPRHFSFNSPFGACETCSGLGTTRSVSEDLVLGDPSISILEGVVLPWGEPDGYLRKVILPGLAKQIGFDLNSPWGKLTASVRQQLLHGVVGVAPGARRGVRKAVKTASKSAKSTEGTWEGIVTHVQRRYDETSSDAVRLELEQYMVAAPCPSCEGRRLRPESLAVTVHGENLGAVVERSVGEALTFFDSVPVRRPGHPGLDPGIAGPILKEVRERLRFLVDVGLDYLTLNRSAESLSGGEAQRIRLATQIGSRLVGVLYILDEPSIGLHQRDNGRLLTTLKQLRDLGNTVIVVEHDEETIREADHVIDLGPGAGKHGGAVIAEGTIEDILANPASITGGYLSGARRIEVPAKRRARNADRVLTVHGAREHNLKDVTAEFPLGLFVAVTGVSGSGKSTLITDILQKSLSRHFFRARVIPGAHSRITGLDHLDKIIDIDQSPIGRTPRSNPATYTGIFTPVRELFAELPEAKIRGYGPGRFSFNVKGGRCEACQGDGLVKIEMHFLPDVFVPCDVCKGKRFNRETLEVRFRGLSIAEVLDLTVEDACGVFENQPRIVQKLETLRDVGLGYIHLGQSATTLSGGEAQRVKLATELSKRDTGRTLYILDEPTTGLHFEDVRVLLDVLHKLVDRGNTVLVIEHNLDVIKTADWIVDMGPEGGVRGGTIVAQGTPEQVVKVRESHTGQYLKPLLR